MEIKNNTTNDFNDIEAKYISGKDYESRNRVNIQSQGFSDIEFSMVKYKEDKPYICKTSRYNEDFDDKDKWEELNI